MPQRQRRNREIYTTALQVAGTRAMINARGVRSPQSRALRHWILSLPRFRVPLFE